MLHLHINIDTITVSKSIADLMWSWSPILHPPLFDHDLYIYTVIAFGGAYNSLDFGHQVQWQQ